MKIFDFSLYFEVFYSQTFLLCFYFSPFLGSVMVQLLPYKVEHRCTFQGSAQSAGVVYQVRYATRSLYNMIYNLSDFHLTRLHEFFYRGIVKNDIREKLLIWKEYSTTTTFRF